MKNKELDNKVHWIDTLKYRYIFLFFVFLIFIYFFKVIFGISDFWEDLINLEYPFRVFAKNSIMNLSFPHWNPYSFGGTPFFSTLYPGVLYPGNLLISLLPVGNAKLWYLIQISVIVHLLIGSISMFYLMKFKKCSNIASMYAAISFMFCGFFVSHIIHSLMINIIVWLPLIVLYLEKSLNANRVYYSVIAGLILGLSTLAGHAQITFYEFMFLGLYSLLYIINSKNIKLVLPVAIFFGIAIGIAAIQYLPVIELTQYSSRANWTFKQLCEGSMSFPQLLTLLMPKVFGAYTGPSSGAPTYWLPGHMNGYYTYWDTTFYMGFGVFLFAIIQIKKIKTNTFIKLAVIWAIISISVALGQNFFIYKLLYDYVPGFNRFRSPARILFTWNFLFPMLAAFTLDQIKMEGLKKERKIVVFGLVISLCIAFFTMFGFLNNFWPVEMASGKNAEYASLQGVVLLLNILFLTIPLVLLWKDILSLKNAQMIILFALIFDMFLFGMNHHVNKNSNAPKFYSQNKTISNALKSEAEKEIFRSSMRQFVLSENEKVFRQSSLKLLKRNQGYVDNIELYEGFNPLQLEHRVPVTSSGRQFQTFLDLLNIKYFIDPTPVSQLKTNNVIRVNSSYMPRAKMFYDFKKFSSDSLAFKFMQDSSFDYKETLLLHENISIQSDGKHSDNKNVVKITKYKPNEFELYVSTDKDGILWLSEIWYPAWKAYVDGKPINVLRANYSFRAIEILKGEHKVIFKYQSKFFMLGLYIFLLTFFSSLIYLIYYKVKK